ncbi:MAG: site-specific DNA-methyltransferase [Candidatus Kapabacteria bacterium]|nr:site-specific DNA-methyltransferase [Candidatus Kapabacteria bacterium]
MLDKSKSAAGVHTSAVKQPARNNRTLSLLQQERAHLQQQIFTLQHPVLHPEQLYNRVIHGNMNDVCDLLPLHFVDLLILDPPYNMTKKFNGSTFTKSTHDKYASWFESWFVKVLPALKETASIYVCADWHTSTAVFDILEKYTTVRNRITFERDKGRGAYTNWKNCSEDIWFCTMGEQYTFNVDAVKVRKKVLASYRHHTGEPKDWKHEEDGKYRMTFPSNLWTDITIPFWSMPENTNHPTQKPEKLLAKLILASSNPGDVVLDPFLGSGTTAVTAKKLHRTFLGVEMDEEYCLYALKRLASAEHDKTIQGYENGIFLERNSL